MEPLKCQVLILKVASRCNLNCSYCYMYNLGDSTYKNQPKFMSYEVVDSLLERVLNHCLTHGLRYFQFVFHGGEPLLAPINFYRNFVSRAKSILAPKVKPFFSLQTNGVLLSEEWCALFAELEILVGISLDGNEKTNDKFRIDHQGKGAYKEIIKGLRTAQQSRFLKYSPNILCVIDVFSDPLETYEHFKKLGAKMVSLLFPYGTYDNLPQGITGHGKETLYADWLLAVFHKWFDDPAPKPKIRLFEQFIELIIGIDRGFEYLGRKNLEFLVIETDGGIEAAGALKACGNGFTKKGMNVLKNELDEALNTDLAKLYHLSHHKLPLLCQSCELVEVCGGGFLPNRYSKEKGFDNPSLYCLDLIKIITEVQRKLLQLLPEKKLPADFHLLEFKKVESSLEKRKKKLIDSI